MLRQFIVFVLAAFVAMLLMATLYAGLGIDRTPLTGGPLYALLDVLAYAALTMLLWITAIRIFRY